MQMFPLLGSRTVLLKDATGKKHEANRISALEYSKVKEIMDRSVAEVEVLTRQSDEASDINEKMAIQGKIAVLEDDVAKQIREIVENKVPECLRGDLFRLSLGDISHFAMYLAFGQDAKMEREILQAEEDAKKNQNQKKK